MFLKKDDSIHLPWHSFVPKAMHIIKHIIYSNTKTKRMVHYENDVELYFCIICY